ncbi:multidrug efflux SMR transporter [Flammeovirga yaeyamensis]|uniref:Guanidinium exporter n=1 Tax=Flammeovirga yaeyamensis TaxID=367791 RepID=A0AAX1NEB8_9BACT|nr:multidrug efflux SMR transporter [Flammeovirga yaeyamensis]MBB3696546.1 quaternary ammonium compound-resistance protein SugE [Flammeovirga yaeyamensis]NMF33225.1 multidrug efflux SMR transporter [Flammeovirga yaeyamensis]QWG05496.1 multidrug efflux SMR transporter [Flammeovirga yaeyamensis]
MSWIYLILSGLFEVGFTTSMKLSDGFTNWKGVVGFLVFGALSFGLLLKSMQTIETGTAYAVWAGIGASGTILMGLFYFNDAFNAYKLMFLSFIIIGIIGIKLSS